MKKVKSGVSHVEVGADRSGQRLDNFLAARLKGVPRSLIYRIIRTGQVRINGGRAKPSSRLQTGDVVRVPPAPSRAAGKVSVPSAVLELLAASICFESHGVLVVNKPAGMAVHAGSGLSWGVVDALRALRPGKTIDLVHRLDRDTSGCLMLAYDGTTLRDLQRQLSGNRIDKHYLCLLDGRLPEDLVDIDQPIGRSGQKPERHMQVDPTGKPARTTFRLLQRYRGYSFVEARLYSGRTHQIRVHAAHLGLPLAGDRRYAVDDGHRRWQSVGLKRLFLHAHKLAFDTADGERQFVGAALPAELAGVLDRLKPYSAPPRR